MVVDANNVNASNVRSYDGGDNDEKYMRHGEK